MSLFEFPKVFPFSGVGEIEFGMNLSDINPSLMPNLQQGRQVFSWHDCFGEEKNIEIEFDSVGNCVSVLFFTALNRDMIAIPVINDHPLLFVPYCILKDWIIKLDESAVILPNQIRSPHLGLSTLLCNDPVDCVAISQADRFKDIDYSLGLLSDSDQNRDRTITYSFDSGSIEDSLEDPYIYVTQRTESEVDIHYCLTDAIEFIEDINGEAEIILGDWYNFQYLETLCVYEVYAQFDYIVGRVVRWPKSKEIVDLLETELDSISKIPPKEIPHVSDELYARSIDQDQLADRLGVSGSALTYWKFKEGLPTWSRGKDPDGISWKYLEHYERFFPE